MNFTTNSALSICVSIFEYVTIVTGTSWLDQSYSLPFQSRTRAPMIVCPRNPLLVFSGEIGRLRDVSDVSSQIGQGFEIE